MTVFRLTTRLRALSLAAIPALVGAALVGATLFAASGAAAAATRYPLTVTNCGQPLTFAQAPKRAVSIGQSSTEILLSLGLADRLVGTAVWFGPVLKPFEAVNAKIKRLADNDPSFEAVVGQAPDLVTAQYEWHIGPNGSVGKREQFAALGVPAYVSPADCVEKDNSGSGDGVRKRLFTMDLIYQEIRELAQIFDVADRGEELITTLRAREAAAIKAVAGKGKDRAVVFWFSSKDVKGDAFVAGRNGAPAYILSALGARNVIDTNEEWPLVGWEGIAAANPAVIVIATMDRRRFPADDVEVKRAFLASDPVASRLEAVRHNRVVLMNAQSMNPSIRTIDGLEALAAGLAAIEPGQ
ncbi:ABC transporter substrate-binding protein [Azospirillum griseum]|uniref:ABC transporter substrate-binding protein n=1 Tax=Azospirillum griseum TaxID=2496639 RepID=A0A431VFN7_9PROT|nr:ABC transporter substrate-binding protein [Azospirillum griseum]RTR18135.1 ABC transporter substrate-binding protein [Azospirillum griseum]